MLDKIKNNEKIYNIDNCTNITIIIKVFGYRSQGESIVFELRNSRTGDLFYLGCIDSYELENVNKTLEYLNTLGERKLDFFCWSHPDNDHSRGLNEIYDKACDENTYICIPDTLQEKLNKKLELSDANRRIYDRFELHNNRKIGTLFGIGVSKYGLIDEILFNDAQQQHLRFELLGIAPHDGLIRYWKSNSSDSVKNILSVGLLIKLGEYTFIFSGDMPDESIEMVYSPLLRNPLWIKIPHHGSDTSITMADRITYESKNLYGCTTVFLSKNRPVNEVLNLYMSKGCTRIDSTHTGDHLYGIVEYHFDLFNTESVRIRHYGNACKVRPID